MSTITIWILLSFGYHGRAPDVVLERFAHQEDCQAYLKAIGGSGGPGMSTPYHPIRVCAPAKVIAKYPGQGK